MRLPIFIFTSLLVCRLASGATDSLLRFCDLNFKNEVEKKAFRNFLQLGDKADVIDLFLGHYSNPESYSSEKAHQLIKQSVFEIKKETEALNEQKTVKYIYNYIHKHFFKVYQLNNSFSDVFEKGEYNCVSGSAMYALAFELLNIPYQIVEAPQHVFVFAYPQTYKLLIESTTPKNGYINFSDVYMEQFIRHLSENKLVSQTELESSSSNQLFNKYYFGKQGLSLQELAGIQYSNYSYYHLEKQDYEEALMEAKKAYYLFPSERCKYMLESILLHIIANKGYKEKKDFGNLALLCRFNNQDKKDISNEVIVQEFIRLTHEQLITNSNYEKYEEGYTIAIAAITDTSLKKEIGFVYHYELARLGNANFKKREYEISHLENAYRINPKYADLQLIIKSYLSHLIEQSNDPTAALKDLDYFMQHFNFLERDEKFNIVRANYMLELVYQDYTLQNPSRGESNLQKFEKLSAENNLLNASERFVEKAYSTAAIYHYKKGNKTKAREILKNGMKHAPANFGLQMRYNQIK